jgi:hypothetical protein
VYPVPASSVAVVPHCLVVSDNKPAENEGASFVRDNPEAIISQEEKKKQRIIKNVLCALIIGFIENSMLPIKQFCLYLLSKSSSRQISGLKLLG